MPRILVSDNGTQFTGARVQKWCEEMGIQQGWVSVAYPQANGQVKVTNRTIVNGIKAKLEGARESWADELDSVLWTYRTSSKTATWETPFNFIYGTLAVIPTEVRIETTEQNYEEKQNKKLKRENLDLVEEERKIARLRDEKYKKLMKGAYNKKVRRWSFEKGDLVLWRTDALKPTGKLELSWEGPNLISRVLGGGAYQLKDENGYEMPRPWNIVNLK